ncbi:hypothetical protein HDU98_006267 [Podochytrium sp. JEL0797]|nr:hypothetical protein HDU98_006267 [Podochytrium sp. JEL0797]
MISPILALAAATMASVSAQTPPFASGCERLVDDMTPRNASNYKTDHYGNNKTLNHLGGDYGADSGSSLVYNFAPTSGHMTLTPGWVANPENGDPLLHPADIIASNYMYMKFVWDDQISSTQFGLTVCEDLTPYAGLFLNVSMPVGSDVYMTLTQKNEECTERTRDSEYVKLSQFHTPTGAPQPVLIPFSAMSLEFDKTKPFNFTHAKDITFVNFSPPNVEYSFYHIGLIKNTTSCMAGGDVSTATMSGSVAATGSRTEGVPVATSSVLEIPTKTGAAAGVAGLVGAAVVAMVFAF